LGRSPLSIRCAYAVDRGDEYIGLVVAEARYSSLPQSLHGITWCPSIVPTASRRGGSYQRCRASAPLRHAGQRSGTGAGVVIEGMDENRDILISGASVAEPALACRLSRHGFHPTMMGAAH
jgi:hypothetical protein